MEKVREATYEEVSTEREISVGNSRLGLGVIMVMAAFLGLWGTACIISALSTLSSLEEVGKTLISALLGV